LLASEMARTRDPATMRIFARRERPRPGAKLSLFENQDGYRYQLWVTNPPETTKGWRGKNAYIDAAHRVHAKMDRGDHPGLAADHRPPRPRLTCANLSLRPVQTHPGPVEPRGTGRQPENHHTRTVKSRPSAWQT
jgi:hypothetical protein